MEKGLDQTGIVGRYFGCCRECGLGWGAGAGFSQVRPVQPFRILHTCSSLSVSHASLATQREEASAGAAYGSED